MFGRNIGSTIIIAAQMLVCLLTIAAAEAKTSNIPTVDCGRQISQYIRPLTQMLNGPSPWHGVDTREFRFGFVDAVQKKVFLFGYTSSIFNKAKIEVAQCKLDSRLFLMRSHAEAFLNIAASTAEGIDGAVDTSHPLFEFSERNALMVLPLQIESDDVTMKKSVGQIMSNSSILPRIMLHELFHGYTSSGGSGLDSSGAPIMKNTRPVAFKDFTEPGVLVVDQSHASTESCRNSQEFLQALQSEFEDWKELEWSSDKPKGPRRKLLISKIKLILERRANASEKSLLRYCWRNVRDMERMEGVAQYFESALTIQAKLPKANENLNDLVLSTSNPEIFERGFDFYYVTGAKLCHAAATLDPSGQWQEWIRDGLSPEDVVRKLLEAKLKNQ